MTLTEFLEDRIAERQAIAEEAKRRVEHMPPGVGGVGNLGLVGFPFWEVLAECEAKRQIVAQVIDLDLHDGYTEATRDAVRALAAVHADHPDYRAEWSM